MGYIQIMVGGDRVGCTIFGQCWTRAGHVRRGAYMNKFVQNVRKVVSVCGWFCFVEEEALV